MYLLLIFFSNFLFFFQLHGSFPSPPKLKQKLSLRYDDPHGVGRARGGFLHPVDDHHLVPRLDPAVLLADVDGAEDD